MRRQLFVHIGMPKCASTSIQAALGRLAPTLGRWRIHYPRSGRGMLNGHFGLFWDSEAWTELTAEIRRVDATTFVLSAEQFIGRARQDDWPGRVAALAEETRLNVRVVGYVRPQCQMLEAQYGQWTRYSRNAKAFEDFAAECLASGRLEFNSVFEPWRRVFGTRAMVVTPLERSRLEGDVVTHFLDLLGCPAPRWAARLRTNPRPMAKQLEVARLTNLALGEPPLSERRGLKDGVFSMLRFLFRNDLPVCPLTVTEACGVMSSFEEANARFARDYGIDADGMLFREPVIDGRKRPYRGSWQDFSDRERRLARRVVQDVAGVDIAPGRGADVRATDRLALVYAAGMRYGMLRVGRLKRRLRRLR